MLTMLTLRAIVVNRLCPSEEINEYFLVELGYCFCFNSCIYVESEPWEARALPWANPCLSPKRDLTHSFNRSQVSLLDTIFPKYLKHVNFFFSFFLGFFDRRYDGRGPLLPDEPEEAWSRGDHQQSR